MKSCPKCNGSGRVPDDAAIGAKLRAARIKKGVSLREMARRLDVSAMWICDLERGKRYWNDWKRKYEEAL